MCTLYREHKYETYAEKNILEHHHFDDLLEGIIGYQVTSLTMDIIRKYGVSYNLKVLLEEYAWRKGVENGF